MLFSRATGNKPGSLRTFGSRSHRPPSLRRMSLSSSSRDKQDVPRLNFGSPARIFAEGRDGRQCCDHLATLHDEGVVAEALAYACGRLHPTLDKHGPRGPHHLAAQQLGHH